MASVYENKSSGQWMVKYYWKSDYFYAGFKHKAEAEAFKETIEADINLAKKLKCKPRFLSANQDTMEPDCLNPTLEAFEKLFHSAHRHHAANTTAAYSYAWKQFTENLKVKRIAQITPEIIRDWRDNGTIKDISKNSYLRRLVIMFNWAVQEKHIPSNPASKVKLLRLDNNPKPYLTRDEINKLLVTAGAHGLDIYRFCMLGCLAGLRANEILNSRWEWFRFGEQRGDYFQGGTLTVMSGDNFRVKNRAARSLPLHRTLSLHFQTNKQASGYLIKPDRNYGGDRWAYEKQLSTVLKNCGLEKVNRYGKWQNVNAHLLRHSCASQLAQSGMSAYEIMIYMGWNSLAVAEGYMHLAPSEKDLNW